jgi:hypothetical protein
MSNSPKPYLDAPSCLDVLALAAATIVDQVEHRPPAAARGPGVRERVHHVRILETTEDCYAKREFARTKPYRVAADLVATAKDLAVTNVKQKPQERTVPGLGDVLLVSSPGGDATQHAVAKLCQLIGSSTLNSSTRKMEHKFLGFLRMF